MSRHRPIGIVTLVIALTAVQLPSALAEDTNAVLRGYNRANRLSGETMQRAGSSSSSRVSSTSSSAPKLNGNRSSSSSSSTQTSQRRSSSASSASSMRSSAASASQKAQGNIVDIGVQLLNNSTFIYASSVTAFSPADVAGMKAGDTIVEIEGKKWTINQSTADVLSRLNGPEGTSVHIVVGRQNAGEIPLTIVRKTVAAPRYDYHSVSGIAYVKVSSFAPATLSALESDLQKNKAQNAQSLILDLRDNPSGNVSDIVNFLGLFLPKGQKVGFLEVVKNTKGVAQGNSTLTTTRAPLFSAGLKIVVLVHASQDQGIRLACFALYKPDGFHLVMDESNTGRMGKDVPTFTAADGKSYSLDEGFAHLLTASSWNVQFNGSLYSIVDASIPSYGQVDTKDTALEKALKYVQ